MAETELKSNRAWMIWLCLAAAVWCGIVGAVPFQQYGIYQLSRWGICAAAAIVAVNLPAWRWPMVATAILFNPIAPIHLNRDTWQVLDFVASGLFVVGTFISKRSK